VTESAVPDSAPGTPSGAGQSTVVRGNAVWLPAGSPTVTVGGYAISGGMFYLGTALPAAYAAGFEPALVDPKLPVRRVRLDQETPAEGETFAYGELTAGARAAYLEWLSCGRVGPTAPAHLWLFLYGLERRVLIDLANTLGRAEEYAAISEELAGLRTRYPAVAGFDRQAGLLADLVSALAGLDDPVLRPPAPPPGGPGTELPVALRVGLGRYVAGGQPISATWAYAWLAHHPERGWEVTASPLPDEHRREFAAAYEAAYPGGGMVVRPPAEELILAYRPASPGFADRTVRVHTKLPDVAGLPAPLHAPPSPAQPAPEDLDLDALEATLRRVRERDGHQPWTPAAPPTEEPPRPPLSDRPLLAAAEALLRLVSLAGLADEEFRAVRRYAVDTLGLGVTDRHELDDRLDAFAHRRPTVATIKQRFAMLAPGQHDAVAQLLIATAGASGTLEPALIAVLDEVFALLGPGPADLARRLGELEVASVSFDSSPGARVDTTVLDPDTVERTLAAAPDAAALIDKLTAPAPRYATT
jgi:hypothetical protein